MKKHDFIPDWLEREPDQQTFRSIFKWGAKDRFKNPGQGFFSIIKEELGLSNTDFQTPVNLGNKRVENTRKTRISKEDITLFKTIVGRENLFLDTYSRLKYSTGKSMEDIFNLRQEKIENICDIVVHPRNRADIIKIVALCHEKKI
ncbi:MAG: FAD-binding oxidoreductase, partial [Desulfobacula sp.]|nr:FAD-binding oxidoreductase [Desulfobacula sp.]